MPSTSATRVTIEEHPASSLSHDERVQRSLRPGRVRDIMSKFDPDAVGVITVSKRSDNGHPGQLVILDGQHRIQALIDSGRGDTLVTCRVYHGLDIPREAGIFRRLNNTSKTSAIEDLLKGVTEGDPESVAISKIAARFNLRIALQVGDGLIACAASMRKIYRSGPQGPAALGFALHIATSAWGATSDSVDGAIVVGLGALYLRYGESIERDALITKLAKHKGGPPGILGQAKAWRDLRPGHTVGKCVALVALDLYNRGRRTRLPAL